MEIAEQVVSLLAVFGLLALAVWACGRNRGRQWRIFSRHSKAAGAMLVEGRLMLTPQHVLHLVRVGDRTLLLATHPQGVSFDVARHDFSTEFQTAVVRTHEAGQ